MVNMGSFLVTLLVDHYCVPINIPNIAGIILINLMFFSCNPKPHTSLFLINYHIHFARNNVFYKNLHEKALEIFGPIIRTWWNSQNDKLKDDLMNHMVNLFGDTFNKKGVTAAASLNLKYVREYYRDNL